MADKDVRTRSRGGKQISERARGLYPDTEAAAPARVTGPASIGEHIREQRELGGSWRGCDSDDRGDAA